MTALSRGEMFVGFTHQKQMAFVFLSNPLFFPLVLLRGEVDLSKGGKKTNANTATTSSKKQTLNNSQEFQYPPTSFFLLNEVTLFPQGPSSELFFTPLHSSSKSLPFLFHLVKVSPHHLGSIFSHAKHTHTNTSKLPSLRDTSNGTN
jgi:hypothetical protein